MKRLWIAVIAALGVLVASAAGAQTAGIEVGADAPDAVVETLGGETVHLADFMADGPVVLEFWATWCPLCKELEEPMAEAREKYGDQVTFVGVGVPQNQSAGRQRAYIEEHGLGGEFVFDAGGAAIAAYSVPHTSYVVIVDSEGTVAYTGVGADQDVMGALADVLGSGMGMENDDG